MTDPAGVVTACTYDANGQKITATSGYGTNSAATTWFDHDAGGNLITVTDPSGNGLGMEERFWWRQGIWHNARSAETFK